MPSHVLALFPDLSLAPNLRAVLYRPSYEVHPVPSDRTALVLSRHLAYDLIVAGYPLAQLDLEALLTGVHDRESASAATPVLILAPRDALGSLAGINARPLVQVVDETSTISELQSTISRLLGVARRAPGRIMVRLQASLEGWKVARVCQTQDVSESGLLLKTSQLLPVGTPVDLHLDLPEDPRPIRTRAVVVRHARPPEKAKGIAVRFVELPKDGCYRLRDYVARLDPGF